MVELLAMMRYTVPAADYIHSNHAMVNVRQKMLPKRMPITVLSRLSELVLLSRPEIGGELALEISHSAILDTNVLEAKRRNIAVCIPTDLCSYIDRSQNSIALRSNSDRWSLPILYGRQMRN